MALWRCPNCGREFARSGQSHSCVKYSVEDHFRGKPAELKKMFDLLVRELELSGPVDSMR